MQSQLVPPCCLFLVKSFPWQCLQNGVWQWVSQPVLIGFKKSGASVFWIVWILIAVCFPIAWPIAKLLDFLLGAHESLHLFKRSELKELMNLHGTIASGGGDDALCNDEITIIKGNISPLLLTSRYT